MTKRVAIIQSNYIPWKGYFNIIKCVDHFVLLDDVQYTRRDWRNRNLIKAKAGLKWLTIPVAVKNNYHVRIVIEYSKGDQPPLFFIYIHYVFKIFWFNEIVRRIACAFIGLLSIAMIYFLGKECQGKLTGLFAALLTGINYFHIYYSQELRFYSMAFLCATLSYLFYIRA